MRATGVTVWNRTRHKAEILKRDGATVAASPEAEVAASPVVVVCVRDYRAANEILDTRQVTVALAGRALVQLTSVGFIHGARIAESQGIPVDQYGSLVADISPTFGEFFRHEGAVFQSGNYILSESPLRISVEATERLARAARAVGANAELPELVSRLFQRAAAEGYGEEEVAALIKVQRTSATADLPARIAG